MGAAPVAPGHHASHARGAPRAGLAADGQQLVQRDALWDHVHGTYRGAVPDSAITIGVDDPQALADVPRAPALLAPFAHTPDRARPAHLADQAHIG